MIRFGGFKIRFMALGIPLLLLVAGACGDANADSAEMCADLAALEDAVRATDELTTKVGVTADELRAARADALEAMVGLGYSTPRGKVTTTTWDLHEAFRAMNVIRDMSDDELAAVLAFLPPELDRLLAAEARLSTEAGCS